MFLSLNALGSDAVFQTAIPPKVEFEDIIFIGECTIDDLHVKNLILTTEDIEAITEQQEWGDNTVLIARFENQLEAGNLINSDLPITSWRIYRKKSTDLIYKLLIEIPFDPTVSSFVDTTGRNNVEYQYEVRPVSEGTEGNGIMGVAILDFWGWTLSSEDGTTIFKFDMELDTSAIKTISDLTKTQNYTKYPVLSKGKAEYEESSISCMPYELINNQIEVTTDVLLAIKSFVNNSQSKILRSPSGLVWKVQTYNFSYDYMDKIQQQPYTISFEYSEIGEVNE